MPSLFTMPFLYFQNTDRFYYVRIRTCYHGNQIKVNGKNPLMYARLNNQKQRTSVVKEIEVGTNIATVC